MKIKEANLITGGLSNTSKMPCPSFSTPPDLCKMGALYGTYKNSVCTSCYAKKGFSYFKVVKEARLRRHEKWYTEPKWKEAMITLIRRYPYFRWFDAGDIFDAHMFLDICNVCAKTPNTQHWLPTLERSVVIANATHIPSNLTVRFSSPILDKPSSSHLFPISYVSTTHGTCPATTAVTKTNQKCGSCRDCWDPSIQVIAYQKH